MTASTSSGSQPRGRIAKQQAVLAAAFTVFTSAGYTQARIDDIAAAAGVAKATVYNHFSDKETLFREAVRALSEAALAANLAAVEQLADTGDGIAATLRSVGTRLAACYCAPESRAMRRLISAEAERFPDLLDIVDGVSRRVIEALADRLARLSLAGTLGIVDPDLAAVQFTSLLTGPLEIRYRLGMEPVPDTELAVVAEAAVHTFLAAFGP
ncbi:TetR/AcrR family transcriptional regulator C-terminal domain-containing protein [Nocardia donostiensis]|uniref:TetR family transcriptional regulator n=1 Tax=Nocardia donostiensis TaxID=1538463 RepID=A0A1W0B6X2_9NOCA|nr:TetR/AcrR family transcriptional regulator C-terminal domain-containing protein [Nocardia donostiensis]ONM46223.1 TetR family transcriptional regulator [Nocardia donostiensis]OQS14992.1 TetR family transcriptional regulator [Nocardia donostiensis]OQS18272.1 TetR family transcriptional regulator [Nocardia donostiensis]